MSFLWTIETSKLQLVAAGGLPILCRAIDFRTSTGGGTLVFFSRQRNDTAVLFPRDVF